MAGGSGDIELTMAELRAVAGFAADCALAALEIYERAQPGDPRPREAIEAASAFAAGGKRGKVLRDTAWAALKAAGAANTSAAGEAVRAAMAAAGAAYLHPLANATQVKHILGAAAHAARAAELLGGDADEQLARAARRAAPLVIEVLRRYPAAPTGGGRVGELIRELDHALREQISEL
ncbi:exonuclease SbcC [Asanoa sp. WMMD1127]|uniref:putative immunity protein n=1 Tax=Asanoa sp. WMMD1127 TaxID=3016107 RepID=UPI0024163366|nr:exonuclease SbcC [Asanoa sp. WMMD1127]MDG4821916.1 exonuclease SbcC [Asanoa sp. WMMD1127]